MNPVLYLSDFGLAFDSRVILRGLSFAVPAEGCTVLLGPSGTGKSTLLRTLAGLTVGHPQLRLSGEARYREQPCTGSNRPVLVEQKPQALMSTVLENLVCEMPDRSQLTRPQQVIKISAWLEHLGLQALLNSLACQVIDLPLAEQRMVAILRKALAAPDLLMVDEPTANLADEGVAAIMALLRHLTHMQPLLVVMHHLAQTRQLADHVILMANGATQESAPTAQFFTAPQTEAARQFLRTGSCPETGLNPCDEDVPSAPPAPAPALAAPPPCPPQPQKLPDPTPYRHARWGPRGFVWLMDGLVAGTPLPGVLHDTDADLRALHEVGITRLISLTETPFDPATAAPHGICCAASPMPDMHAPSLAQAVQLCQDIDRFLAAGERVAVHCKAGLGRTGTVLGAYWIWRHAGPITGEQALSHIRRLESGMVQSAEQEAFLSLFADAIHA